MAYLDEDVLYSNIEEKYKVAKGKAREAYSDVLDTICEMPRAAVVPKSEVERLQGGLKAEERHNELTMEIAQKALTNAKAEVARDIIGIIDKRMELRNEQCKGIHNEIVLSVYRGQLDAYRDVKEIIEQKYGGQHE